MASNDDHRIYLIDRDIDKLCGMGFLTRTHTRFKDRSIAFQLTSDAIKWFSTNTYGLYALETETRDSLYERYQYLFRFSDQYDAMLFKMVWL